MLRYLFLEPPAADCLFSQLYPSNSQAFLHFLDRCAEQQIRVFTITALLKGIALPLAMAQPLLDLINQEQQASYLFADLPLRIQKDASPGEIQDRIRGLNQLRQKLDRAATAEALAATVATLTRVLRWFKYRSLPLLYQSDNQHYELAMLLAHKEGYPALMGL